MAAPQRTLDEVKGWDDEAVASWARGSGLSAPVVEFLAKQAIDGEELFELTEANLVAYSLPLGHAKKLLRAIGILKAETGGFVTSASELKAATAADPPLRSRPWLLCDGCRASTCSCGKTPARSIARACTGSARS